MPVRCAPSLVAVLLAAAPLLAAAAPNVKPPGTGWEEANRTDELVIFTKDNKAAEVREIYAVSDMDSEPVKVFQVLFALEDYSKFMPYTNESKLSKKISDTEVISYQLISPPLVSKRDYYIRVKTTRPSEASGTYKTEWTAVPDFGPEKDDVVRVKLNTGSWTFEPLDGGKRTRVIYSLLTHPGGSIPSWIANASNTTAIPDLFKAVRKRAAEK